MHAHARWRTRRRRGTRAVGRGHRGAAARLRRSRRTAAALPRRRHPRGAQAIRPDGSGALRRAFAGADSTLSACAGWPESRGICSAYPGTDDDGVRWLAFESFSGMSAPREKTGAASGRAGVVDARTARRTRRARATGRATRPGSPRPRRPGASAPAVRRLFQRRARPSVSSTSRAVRRAWTSGVAGTRCPDAPGSRP